MHEEGKQFESSKCNLEDMVITHRDALETGPFLTGLPTVGVSSRTLQHRGSEIVFETFCVWTSLY